MDRIYSILQTKALDEDRRIIHGIATDPSTDRVGDVVESEGAEFKLPLPFLMHHDTRLPVGTVTHAEVSKSGIAVQIQLAKVTEPGALKDRVDLAWAEIKSGLIRGLSIGFNAIEVEPIKTKGVRFKRWTWLELSGVVVPANASANITTIRSLDSTAQAALGTSAPVVVTKPPGASGPSIPKPIGKSMNLSEQISTLETNRVSKAHRLTEIMAKSADEGRTADEGEAHEFDDVEAEIKAIDQQLTRLRTAEKYAGQTAVAVVAQNGHDASVSRGNGVSNGSHIVVKPPPKLPPGIEFARFTMCVAAGRGNLMQSYEIAKHNFGENSDLAGVMKHIAQIGSTTDPVLFQKAPVQGATTTDQEWAGPLVFAYPRYAADFVEYLRPQTIIGRFGTNGIPSLRHVPFNINIAGQTSGGQGYWVGEGAPKPLTQWQYTSTNLRWAKVANIAVITEELARFSSPAAEGLVRDELARALIERLDIDFIDPAKAAVTNVSPASITNGVVPTLSQGNYGDAVRQDIANVLGKFIAPNVNISPTSAVWIMSTTKALALSIMRNALGAPEFPGMTINGGTLEGIPVIASQYIGQLLHTGGEIVVLVNADDIWLGDDGQVTVDASREASLQMDSAPTEEGSGGTGATMVSMFQVNGIALRAERYINWQKRRAQAVQVLGNVFWGSSTASGT